MACATDANLAAAPEFGVFISGVSKWWSLSGSNR